MCVFFFACFHLLTLYPARKTKAFGPKLLISCGRLLPVMVSWTRTHISISSCFPPVVYPGDHGLGASFLILLFVLQRIIVPLAADVLLGSATVTFTCNVCNAAQVWFPWPGRARRAVFTLCSTCRLPGHPSVLVNYCIYVFSCWVIVKLSGVFSMVMRGLVGGVT